MKHIATILTLLPFALFGVTFETMNLSQQINTNSISAVNEVISKTNGTFVIGDSTAATYTRLSNNHGITFDIHDDGEFCIYFDEGIESNPMKRILVNDVPLDSTIKNIVMDKINECVSDLVTSNFAQTVSNIV